MCVDMFDVAHVKTSATLDLTVFIISLEKLVHAFKFSVHETVMELCKCFLFSRIINRKFLESIIM